jgi:hypothetical protein
MASEKVPELIKALEGKSPEILLALLSEYADRWRHNSNQIWSTGSVFIPLSLSGVALGVGDPYRTLAVAIFSLILIWIWYSMSERLRIVIDRNWLVYSAVESALLKIKPPLLKYGIDELIPTKPKKYVHLRKVRAFIPIIITIAWVFTVALSFIL